MENQQRNGNNGQHGLLDEWLALQQPVLSKFQIRNRFLMNTLNQELRNIENGVPNTSLFRFQIEAISQVVQYFGSKPSGTALVVAPTGSGKSGLVALLPTALSCRKVLIITPSKIISTQIQIAFGGKGNKAESFVRKVGIIPANYTTPLKNFLETPFVPENTTSLQEGIEDTNLVIVNAHKFGGRSALSLSNPEKVETRNLFDDFDTVIVDEAHHFPAVTWQNIIRQFSEKRVILLTATPVLGTLKKNFDLRDFSVIDEVFSIDKGELISLGVIRECKFLEKNLKHEEYSNGYFQQIKTDIEAELELQQRQEPRFNNKQQVLILAKEKKDCVLIANKLTGLGLTSTYITSEADQRSKDSFNNGSCRIGVICKMWLEGYDNSNVTLCVILRGVKSLILFEQFIGRCVRINRNLADGNSRDRTIARVLTYTKYYQQSLWDWTQKCELNGRPSTEEDDSVMDWE